MYVDVEVLDCAIKPKVEPQLMPLALSLNLDLYNFLKRRLF